MIIEVNNRVAIRESLTLHSIIEDDFLLPIGIHSLNLSITSYILVNYLGTGGSFGMVLSRVFKTEILLLLAGLFDFIITFLFDSELLLGLLVSFISLLDFKLLLLIVIVVLRLIYLITLFTASLLIHDLSSFLLITEGIPLLIRFRLLTVRRLLINFV